MSTGPNPPHRAEGATRMSTGVVAVDTMLMGGLLPGRPYLIVGPSGTGKTSLALQFLIDGVRRGERCLLVTLEEPPNEIRQNHRGLLPELDRVFVFDAIPDVMRYERAPFKDIAQVRESVPFGLVPPEIRKTAELASVEVTFSALEQTLKMEIARRSFNRIAIDSLTALQYFCMKGFDETLGAQTFLRFLSDLHITTILTVEAPLEDIETPERLLARGEVRLFRWELDGRTVRAVGVEKFRGSQHDARLHPYRISSKGIDVNLDLTISRDTRQEIRSEELLMVHAPPDELADGLARLEQDTIDLASLGVSSAPVLEAIEAALRESKAARYPEAGVELVRARGLVLALFDEYRNAPGAHDASLAARRLVERVASVRAGVPPTPAPEPAALTERLESLAARLRTISRPRPVEAVEPPAPAPTLTSPRPAAPTPARPPPTVAPLHEPVPPVVARPPPPPLPTRRSEDVPFKPGPRAARAPPAVPPPGHHPPLPLSAVPASLPSAAGASSVAAPPVPLPKTSAGAAPTPPVAPPGPVPPSIAVPVLAPEAAKKRRRAAAPRRRAPKPAASPPTAPVQDGAPSLPTVPGATTGDPALAEAKPKKRRAPARKKAPAVMAASAGSPPPEEHRFREAPTPAPSAEPSAPPPASEPDPPADPGGAA